jgi:hypothetical protein
MASRQQVPQTGLEPLGFTFTSRGLAVGRFAWSLALTACVAVSALADIPPPPPAKGFKRVPYETFMKLEKDLPGYKFYTFSRLGLGGKDTIKEELKLGTEKVVAVPSSSSPSVRTGVVAVPEKLVDELKTKEKLAKLLARDEKDKLTPGVVIYETRGTSVDLKESDPRTKVEKVVTISPDEKAGVRFTATETPAPPSPDNEDAEGTDAWQPAQQRWATVIAGIAGTLGFVTLGIWYFRRK